MKIKIVNSKGEFVLGAYTSLQLFDDGSGAIHDPDDSSIEEVSEFSFKVGDKLFIDEMEISSESIKRYKEIEETLKRVFGIAKITHTKLFGLKCDEEEGPNIKKLRELIK